MDHSVEKINPQKSRNSLAAILRHSPFKTEKGLEEELMAIRNSTRTGTKIILYNLKRYKICVCERLCPRYFLFKLLKDPDFHNFLHIIVLVITWPSLCVNTYDVQKAFRFDCFVVGWQTAALSLTLNQTTLIFVSLKLMRSIGLLYITEHVFWKLQSIFAPFEWVQTAEMFRFL